MPEMALVSSLQTAASVKRTYDFAALVVMRIIERTLFSARE